MIIIQERVFSSGCGWWRARAGRSPRGVGVFKVPVAGDSGARGQSQGPVQRHSGTLLELSGPSSGASGDCFQLTLELPPPPFFPLFWLNSLMWDPSSQTRD